MSDAASVTFEGVSKHYRGSLAYHSLREDLQGGLARLLRREDRERDVVRALDDVSFEVLQGQSFAIIGENGAGKSTALKIATRITYPTAGTVRVRGRVGALVEVGTGLHPELTGRENIELFGTILGHTRRDIARHFDAIVEFAGIAKALDQPVKQYSSGMELRLGFSVAAHLEPDVLLVDEAIAVGDAGFHYRCVERMSELVREGRTLVFVSHDMPAIEALCRRAIWLRNGVIYRDGPAAGVVRDYLLDIQERRVAGDQSAAVGSDELQITRVSVHDAHGREVDAVPQGESMTVRLHYRTEGPIVRPGFTVGLGDGRLECFTMASMLIDGDVPDVICGEGYVDCTFARLPLQPKTYEVWASILGGSGYGDLLTWQRLRMFRVVAEGQQGDGPGSVVYSLRDAPVKLPYRWSVEGATTAGPVHNADLLEEPTPIEKAMELLESAQRQLTNLQLGSPDERDGSADTTGLERALRKSAKTLSEIRRADQRQGRVASIGNGNGRNGQRSRA
jgi:ABC-type polysaccharide/polyol phosphate transport system ATPase subunit